MSLLTARLSTVVLSAALVVAGLEAASYAANGHAFSLGGSNSESRPSSLTNTGSGPALSLHAHGAPLAVGNTEKVTHLNADLVDGLNARALETSATTWTIPAGTVHVYLLKGIRPGRYLASFDIALSSSGPAQCALEDTETGNWVAYARGASDGLYVATSASAVVRVPTGGGLRVVCDTDIASQPILPRNVALVPLGSVTQGTTSH